MSLRQGTLVGVSDDSVSHNRGTHAWILTTDGETDFSLSGCGPVDGLANRMTSYRAELQGQLAILILASLLMTTFKGSTGSIETACDNKGVVHKVREIPMESRLAKHEVAEADLLRTYREWTAGTLRGSKDTKTRTLLRLSCLSLHDSTSKWTGR